MADCCMRVDRDMRTSHLELVEPFRAGGEPVFERSANKRKRSNRSGDVFEREA